MKTNVPFSYSSFFKKELSLSFSLSSRNTVVIVLVIVNDN